MMIIFDYTKQNYGFPKYMNHFSSTLWDAILSNPKVSISEEVE